MAPKRKSLLEASFEEQEPQQKVKRVMKSKPSMPQMVAKAIADNCKGMSAQEIDSVLVNGLTMRQQITKDKTTNLETPHAVTMGRRYYQALREDYSTSDNPRTRLVVKNPEEVVSDTLFQAMLSTKKNPVNRGPLLNYLQIAEVPNQAELIGILRWCYDLNPSVSAEQCRGVLETMQYVKRLELMNIFPEEVKLMCGKFNAGMVQALLTKIPDAVELWIVFSGLGTVSVAVGTHKGCHDMRTSHSTFQGLNVTSEQA